jgi:hypothetical protein
MAFTNDAIASNFPYPVLTELGTTKTDPTFVTLQVVHVELNANYSSVHSNRGDGLHGYLALTVNMDGCVIHSVDNVAFDTPT